VSLSIVFFYGGSILHERTLDDHERPPRDFRQNRLNLLQSSDLEGSPRPVLPTINRLKDESDEALEGRRAKARDAYDKKLTDWTEVQAITGDGGVGWVEALAAAIRDDTAMLAAYNTLLRDYDKLQYLRCVHEHLTEFMVEPCTYVLVRGTNVIAQGRKVFDVYRPEGAVHIRRRDTDEAVARKLGNPTALGAFARTASVANYDTFTGPPLNLPQSVSFVHPSGRPRECDVIAGDEPLAGRTRISVNGATTVENKSSLVLLPDMNAFIADMVANADIGFPAFSVSDCNSFHTSGYMWAMYALGKANATHGRDDDAPVLFLNFDQHTDAGDPSEKEMVASDRWGCPALSQVKNGVYMSYGTGALDATTSNPTRGLGKEYKFTNNFFYRINGGPIKTLSINKAREVAGKGKRYSALDTEDQLNYIGGFLCSLRHVWNAVRGDPKGASMSGLRFAGVGGNAIERIEGFPYDPADFDLPRLFDELWTRFILSFERHIKYVYVTVDRDVVQGHQTQWGDGSLFPNAQSLYQTITAVVDSVFDQSIEARLIGFDITGLPESRVVYNRLTQTLSRVDNAWEEMLDELNCLYPWAKARLSPRPDFISAANQIFGTLASAPDKKLGPLTLGVKRKIVTVRDSIDTFIVGDGKTASATTKGIFATRVGDDLRSVRNSLREATDDQQSFSSEQRSFLAGHAEALENLLLSL
jgi:hypothetical protein